MMGAPPGAPPMMGSPPGAPPMMGPPGGAAPRAKTIADNLAIIREDFEICIETHKNYASGAYRPGPLSPHHEQGVAYFQRRLLEAVV